MSEPLRILLLEDNALDAELIQQALEEEGLACVITRVVGREPFLRALQESAADVILSDYLLPGFDGLTALALSREKQPDIPFLFVTGAMGEEVAAESMRQGATDYVLKTNLKRLAPAVRRALREAQLERERRQTEALFQRTLDHMLEGCQIVGPDWRYLYVNDAAARQSRKSKEALLGQMMMQVYPGIERTPLFAVLRECMEKRLARQFENEFVFPDGSKGWFELSVQPAANGLFIRSVDLTLRKQVERRYRDLFENAVEGIFQSTPEGRYVEVNPALARIYGYDSPQEMIASIRDIDQQLYVDPMEREDFMKRLLHNGLVRDYQCRARRKDGSVIWVSRNARAVRDANGNLLYYEGTVEDITPRKLAEEQLKDAIARLEKSNRELQDFAYVASHDLQEPLRKIQAFGDRLKERAQSLDVAAQEYLGRMMAAAQRLEKLIEALLHYSRVTTQARPFELVNLNAVVEEVISDLETRMERSQGTVVVQPLPRIEADAVQMRQLFQNLIGNALKYHREGVPPQVEISAEPMPTSGGAMWRIRVRDNGIGFEEKYLDRIFSPFQRLHSKDRYEGTGIGLAICRKIVERHGGILTAQSKPQEGSVFLIVLPVKQPKPSTSYRREIA